jgi:hypothetical protein
VGTASNKILNGSSVSGDEVGGVRPGIVANGVGDVVGQVLQGPLAGDDGLDEEPEHGEHGEAAVLDLLHLQLRELLRVVGESQRVEAPSRVQRVHHLAERPAGNPVPLHGSHQHNLNSSDGQCSFTLQDQNKEFCLGWIGDRWIGMPYLACPDGEDALCVHEAGVAQVVQAAFAEDLGAGLEPDGLAELDAVAGEELGEDAAERAEHGPPAVDHLKLPVLGERLGVSREPRSVPAVVPRELAGEVGRRLAGQRAEVEDAVRAVPRAAGRRGGLGLGGRLAHRDAALAEHAGGGDLRRLAGESRRGERHGGSGH